MKSNQALNASPKIMDIPSANTGKIKYLHSEKIKKQKVVVPTRLSINESFAKLNAMAKEDPFCFHYKGKNNDTL